MSREMMVVLLGIWVIILPHLGVPNSWHTVITTLTGLALVIVGLYLRGTLLSKGIRRSSHNPFVETTPDIHSHEHHEEAHG